MPRRRTPRLRGYLVRGAFSFNVKGGRCEACQGDGVRQDRDAFPARCVRALRRLPRKAVQPRNAGNAGTRARPIARCAGHDRRGGTGLLRRVCRAIARKLQTLYDVGLGYIKIGQPATTLSGGRGAASQAGNRTQPQSAVPGGTLLYSRRADNRPAHCDDVSPPARRPAAACATPATRLLVIEHNLDVDQNRGLYH